MAIPADDGVSPHYWSTEGVLVDRATGDPVLDEHGEPIEWREPQPDPNASLPYDGPAIWAVSAHRADLPPETAVTLWIEKDSEEEALALYLDTAAAGMELVSISRWEPSSLAQHLRWLAGREGNLAAVIQRG